MGGHLAKLLIKIHCEEAAVEMDNRSRWDEVLVFGFPSGPETRLLALLTHSLFITDCFLFIFVILLFVYANCMCGFV